MLFPPRDASRNCFAIASTGKKKVVRTFARIIVRMLKLAAQCSVDPSIEMSHIEKGVKKEVAGVMQILKVSVMSQLINNNLGILQSFVFKCFQPS